LGEEVIDPAIIDIDVVVPLNDYLTFLFEDYNEYRVDKFAIFVKFVFVIPKWFILFNVFFPFNFLRTC
jgi:hypothetical protein